MKIIYFDNASTTCLRKSVLQDMTNSLSNCYGNPSSTHSMGRKAKSSIERSRKTIAKYLNASPREIIFTSGGTEADNMVIQGSVQYLQVKTIITSKLEHHAVIHTVDKMKEIYGIAVHYVKTKSDGSIDLEDLETLLKKDASKKLVSLMHVNNEIGNILDIDTVTSMCLEHKALFHSDTVQSVGHRLWDLSTQKVDFLVASAHKFHGPKGVGFCYIRKETGLKPLMYGGSQERGLRAGTEAVHAIVGMERAMIDAYENMSQEVAYISDLKLYLIGQLKLYFPKIIFNGLSENMDRSSYNIVNACFSDFSEDKALMLHFHLDMKGIACSKGSACQSGSAIGSHVLNEILPKELFQKPSLRFSLSHYNKKEEIDYVVSELKAFQNS